MPENNNLLKKPPTDFTIDCILSKSDTQTTERQKSPLSHQPLNRVLDNPWISKFPLNLTFNPSSLRKTKSLITSPTSPCSFNLYSLAKTVPTIESQNVSPKNSTSVLNSFYPAATSSSSHAVNGSSESHKLHSKPKVYASSPCDRKSRINPSDEAEKSILPPSAFPSLFERSESIDVCDEEGRSNESQIMIEIFRQVQERFTIKQKYECSECNKKFSQLRNYKYHMSIHRGTKEFAANCPECGKTFNDKGYLSSHMKIHRNKKEYLCPYCPKSFNQRVAFNMHVRIHLGLKPHTCSECGKQFSRKMLLKQHYRTHSGEKPYKCSQPGCEKRFADRSNMILHNRLHSGVKPFACSLCPKRFSKKHHLGTHMNYHTGNKPYLCTHGCGQRFTQSSNMRTHAKKCTFTRST